MALGRTYSVALVGLNGYIVEVEADIGQTLPAFVILGLPDASLNEAKERIRSAAQNSGHPAEPPEDHGQPYPGVAAQTRLGL